MSKWDVKLEHFTGMKYHRCTWWRRWLRLRCPHGAKAGYIRASRYAPGMRYDR